MLIRNTDTGEVLATNAREAASFWSRFRGLMLLRKLECHSAAFADWAVGD